MNKLLKREFDIITTLQDDYNLLISKTEKDEDQEENDICKIIIFNECQEIGIKIWFHEEGDIRIIPVLLNKDKVIKSIRPLEPGVTSLLVKELFKYFPDGGNIPSYSVVFEIIAFNKKDVDIIELWEEWDDKHNDEDEALYNEMVKYPHQIQRTLKYELSTSLLRTLNRFGGLDFFEGFEISSFDSYFGN